jgi:hypothetical protein
MYKVRQSDKRMAIDGAWLKQCWEKTSALSIEKKCAYEGKKPDTKVKLLYDEESLYVIFNVSNDFVRARETRNQEPVCVDSCVEFFFIPADENTGGYFNLEVNCIGTMLFHFQSLPRQNTVSIPAENLDKIEIAASLGCKPVDSNGKMVNWSIEYRLPFEILKGYRSFQMPAPGVIWRVNFYKCGDETTKPHWLSWVPVETQEPNFHRPDSFDRIIFE